MTTLSMTKQIKTPNGYIPLHRSRYHNHIALKDGKIFIYDNSGRDPDETDDGPLIVAEGILEIAGGIKVEAMYVRGDYSSPFGPQASIPVYRKNDLGSTFTTHIDLEGAIKLGRRLGLKVDLVTNVYDPKPKQ